MKVLKLTLRRKWHDLILSGEKTEEYREIKPFWLRQLTQFDYNKCIADGLTISDLAMWLEPFDMLDSFIPFTHVHFFNGGHFGLSLPNAMYECKGITIGVPRPEWSDNAQGNHFIIHLGKRVEI